MKDRPNLGRKEERGNGRNQLNGVCLLVHAREIDPAC